MCSNAKHSTTLSVVSDYFTWRLRNKTSTNTRLFYIVRKVAQSAEDKFHQQQSRFRCPSLSLSNIRSIHNEIGKELFSDGKVTWNRIITFISFSALLTECVIRKYNEDSVVTSMISWTANLIDENLHCWLEKENYWDGCLKAFDQSSSNENHCGHYGNLLGLAVMIACGAMYLIRG